MKKILLLLLGYIATVNIEAGEPFGVNLACAEFGSNFPGTYNKDYTYPTDADLVYWQEKGLRLIRLPFRWERLQHQIFGPLNQFDLDKIKEFVAAAAKRHMVVILDMHNYCRRLDGGKEKILGTQSLPLESFGDFWRRMAMEMKAYDNIYGYGLMNEPHDLPSSVLWKQLAQLAIDSIRTVDKENAIIVGGYHWSSARKWKRYSNNLKKLHDPSSHLIFEAHCYFDKDGSGTYKYDYRREHGKPMIGVCAVHPFVDWLEKNHLRGIVGEYGIPENNVLWEVTLRNFLDYLQWKGIPAVYWASGPWWDNAVMTIPTYHGGKEKSQVSIISQYKETR